MSRQSAEREEEGRHGSRSAELASALAAVYSELRRRAVEAMKHLPPGQTLQPTALVHEAYVALATRDTCPWNDEQHFLALATRAIQCAVVDRIRARKRLKRGGGASFAPLSPEIALAMPNAPDDLILGIDGLMDRLRDVDARAADVVAMRFFMGMSESQVARSLGIADRTVRRDWTFARTWLMKELVACGTQWSTDVER